MADVKVQLRARHPGQEQVVAGEELDRLLAMPPDTFYAKDPVRWMEHVLGIPRETVEWSLLPEYARHEWVGMPDPLNAVCQALADGEDCGVESATGTGKTYLAAGLALWFFACFENAMVITTAPKEDQLTAQLWKEIGQHWPRFVARYPMASTVKLRVRLREGAGEQETWAILGYACGVEAAQESATRAQGFHAPHMLIITEETPGIDPAVMAAFANTSTGSHNLRLALGNPDNQLDPLHAFCVENGVRHVRISGFDHPNVVCGREVIPGAVTKRSLDRLADRWGVGSPMYESRANGVSPAQSVTALIQLAWCEAAAQRFADPDLRHGGRAMGVDVAQSENGDMAARSYWTGATCTAVVAEQCPNATLLGREVALEARQTGVLPQHVGVDSIGVGAATVNELRERLGPTTSALNSGSSPLDGAQRGPGGTSRSWMPDANEHRNLRSQMWWQMREDLRLGRIALPNDRVLFRELVTPQFSTKAGVVVVESKLEIRKRLGKSPDRADAVVYGNWVRPRPEPPRQSREPEVKRDNRAPHFNPTTGTFDRVDPMHAFEKLMRQGQRPPLGAGANLIRRYAKRTP